MLTINDVHSKIQYISRKYSLGNPSIPIQSLVSELNVTKEEIIPYLDALHTRGIITFHDPLKETFAYTGKSMEEN